MRAATRAEKCLVDVPPELLHPLLVAIIVRINVHQALEYFAGLLKTPGIEVGIEQFDEYFKILRLAVQLVVHCRPELQDGQGLRMFGA